MIKWKEFLVILLSNIAVGTILIAITIIIQRNSCDKSIKDCFKNIKEVKH
jgi:hypothetical protein